MALEAISGRLKEWFRWTPASLEVSRKGSHISLSFGRALLVNAGIVYGLWWLVVEALLPGAFNPFVSRMLVIAFALGSFAATYVSRWAAAHVEKLFHVCAWALTLHYFYLIHGNGGQPDWVIGTYFVVVAVNACLQTRASLLAYNAFVMVLAAIATALLPDLRHSLFFAGLLTLGPLTYVGLHHRLKLVAQLERSSQRFQDLFDGVFEGIILHDRGRILDVNASAAAIFGRERVELLGTNVISHWDDAGRESLPNPAKWPTDEPFGVVGIRKDGSRVYLEASAKEHVTAGRTLGLLALRDVSDRRRIEEERIRFIRSEAGREAAEEVVRKQEDFISVAAHELRTPLTSLNLNMQQLSRCTEPTAPETVAKDAIGGTIEACQRQVRRLIRLTSDLLELSQVGQQRVELELEWLELRAVVHDVVESLSEELRNAGCPVEVVINHDSQMRGDRLRLEQVFSNLLRNALIYGGGKPISIRLTGSNDTLWLKVKDRGIGIEAEDQVRIFDRFERAVPSTHYGGLGLGLYFVRQIVLAHGGSISVESALGLGATFTVELPRDPALQRRALSGWAVTR